MQSVDVGLEGEGIVEDNTQVSSQESGVNFNSANLDGGTRGGLKEFGVDGDLTGSLLHGVKGSSFNKSDILNQRPSTIFSHFNQRGCQTRKCTIFVSFESQNLATEELPTQARLETKQYKGSSTVSIS